MERSGILAVFPVGGIPLRFRTPESGTIRFRQFTDPERSAQLSGKRIRRGKKNKKPPGPKARRFYDNDTDSVQQNISYRFHSAGKTALYSQYPYSRRKNFRTGTALIPLTKPVSDSFFYSSSLGCRCSGIIAILMSSGLRKDQRIPISNSSSRSRMASQQLWQGEMTSLQPVARI